MSHNYHEDVRYHVKYTNGTGPQCKVFAMWLKTKSLAYDLAERHGEVTIEVHVKSEAGARAYGGKPAVDRYWDLQSPDSTLHSTIKVQVARS